MKIIPTIIEQSYEGERHYDIFSMLLNERIIMISGEIDDSTSAVVVAQLIYLANKDPNKDIQLYINSPGGSITAGMAIYDTMQYITPDVSTIGMGICASMGAFLLSSGTKGKRYALPNCEIMIHQPLGGGQGQVTDLEIMTKRLVTIKKKMNSILASQTNQPLKRIIHDTERDNFMSPQEALEYGLIDQIITR